MAPIFASREAPVGYSAMQIESLPSLGYELSFGTSLNKVSRDSCIVFYV